MIALPTIGTSITSFASRKFFLYEPLIVSAEGLKKFRIFSQKNIPNLTHDRNPTVLGLADIDDRRDGSLEVYISSSHAKPRMAFSLKFYYIALQFVSGGRSRMHDLDRGCSLGSHMHFSLSLIMSLRYVRQPQSPAKLRIHAAQNFVQYQHLF
jgi:hypothetical protein